jgi:hypothetical protein
MLDAVLVGNEYPLLGSFLQLVHNGDEMLSIV